MERKPIKVSNNGNTFCFKLPPEYIAKKEGHLAILMNDIAEFIHKTITEEDMIKTFDIYIYQFLQGAEISEHDKHWHIWIARGHLPFGIEVLTIESPKFGQIEVAIRWKRIVNEKKVEYQGYSISKVDSECFLIGHNTAGH